MSEQTENPFAALPLRDLHLPEPPGFWPPALGYWLVAGAILACLLLCALYLRRRSRLRYRNQALKELKQLEQQQMTSSELLSALSRLLRRAAMAGFPEYSCSSLTGERWLQFLDDKLKDKGFSEGAGSALATGPYQQQVEYDRAALLTLCRSWLRTLPPRSRQRRQA
jgi:hypothetical protein